MNELLPTRTDAAIGAGIFATSLPLAIWFASLTMDTFSLGQPVVIAVFAALAWFVARARQRGAAILNAREREREVAEAVAKIAAGEPAPEPEEFDIGSMWETVTSNGVAFARMLVPFLMIPVMLAIVRFDVVMMAAMVAVFGSISFGTAFSRAATLHRIRQDKKRRALLTYITVNLGGRDLLDDVELSVWDRVKSAANRSKLMFGVIGVSALLSPFLFASLFGLGAVSMNMIAAFITLGVLISGGLVAKDVAFDFDDVAGHERVELAYEEALSEHADLIGAITEGRHLDGGELSMQARAAGGVALASESSDTVFDFDEDADAQEHIEAAEAVESR